MGNNESTELCPTEGFWNTIDICRRFHEHVLCKDPGPKLQWNYMIFDFNKFETLFFAS